MHHVFRLATPNLIGSFFRRIIDKFFILPICSINRSKSSWTNHTKDLKVFRIIVFVLFEVQLIQCSLLKLTIWFCITPREKFCMQCTMSLLSKKNHFWRIHAELMHDDATWRIADDTRIHVSTILQISFLKKKSVKILTKT